MRVSFIEAVFPKVYSGSYGSDTLLKTLESDVITLKRHVQSNKQIISQHKYKMCGPSAVAASSEALQATGVVEGLDALLSASSTTEATFTALSRVTMRWSNEELLLAVQGVRTYGQDFKAIAEVLGSKSESQVRSFYTNYKRRYRLDEVYGEFLENQKKKSIIGTPIITGDSGADETMDVDDDAISGTGSLMETTLISVKDEESNSSDSFISAADAAELNERLAEQAKNAAAAAGGDTPSEKSMAKGAKSSGRETTPARDVPPDAAPDTPDSSNEAAPTRRMSKGAIDKTAATKAKASDASPTTRPTRTSAGKTVIQA